MTKVLGINFAPLRIPWERRVQTFAVLQWVASFLFMGFGCLFLSIYLLFTKYYFITLALLAWYYYDRKTSAAGGRRSDWVRRWKMWEHFCNFFPIKIHKTTDLNPEKNYIFGIHPHGVLALSSFANFATEGSGFSKIFPAITPYLTVLAGHFQFPVYRDYFMLSGVVEVTRDSMEWLLTRNGTGNALCLVVGGALEALEAVPGRFTLKLKKRKGFIKLALKHGASLVPVFSFGETDIYVQIENPEGSFLRKLQCKMTSIFGFSPPLFHGRGVFNYTFGILPFRTPINTVVGEPIDVEKTDDPSPEQVDSLHQCYMDRLNELYENNKSKYGVKEDIHLHYVD